jgi:hypothetical protein
MGGDMIYQDQQKLETIPPQLKCEKVVGWEMLSV